MAMNYTTLVGAKTVAGSIKNDVSYDKINPDVILTEAQALIYQMLRVREMRALASFSVAVGDSTHALPTGFLDPIGRLRDTSNYRYTQVTEDELVARRVYDSTGTLYSGQPSYWTVLGELIQFDMKFDTVRALVMPYYQSPAVLVGTTNETNFLTTRFPHILRTACKVQAYLFMKDFAASQAELALLSPMIERCNVEADFSYRGADYDQE